MDTFKCVFSEFEFCYEFEPRYIRGYWDGAYSTGSASVGVGWWLRAADKLDSNGQPDWLPQPWFSGYGRCAGTSAAVAEVVAFQCLTPTLNRLFLNLDIDDILPPWNENAWEFDEPDNFEHAPVKIEFDPEDDVCTIYDSSNSSDSGYCSSSSSSSDSPSDKTSDDGANLRQPSSAF